MGWRRRRFGPGAGPGSLLTWAWLRPRVRPLPGETRLEISTPSTPEPWSVAISPDGLAVAFVAELNGQPSLWVRQLNAVSAQALAGTTGASYPFWSPDSRSVGFFAGAS
jgi:WD40-like Beta Propeller Repeat